MEFASLDPGKLLGSVVHGEVQEGDWDFFSFPLRPGFIGVVTINVTGDVWYRVYDDLGGEMAHRRSPYTFEPGETRYYVSIRTAKHRANYRLTVAARAE